MNPEMALVARRQEEREALRSVIAQWNANRLDLFELSEPNQDLEFHGVMRFYFQDSGQKVATKCIRVASDATAQVVIETLIEKFRPDMRMLSVPEYALYEIHENGEERRLEPEEKPLLVQLNWHKDDREGRFLLRRIDDKTNMPEGTFQEGGSSFRRKLSKREKKQLKKQEKINRLKSTGLTSDENDAGVAEKLYNEIPETSFTRSISNPEAVMRRRRQQILERKLQQFRSKDGGPDTGGTLKIYGESLCRDVPYKTLLLSIGDTASHVVREMLIKYGLDKEDPTHYCLVQVNTGADEGGNVGPREYILDDDECPLAILMNHPLSRDSDEADVVQKEWSKMLDGKGSIMFHVRRRPADYHPRKRKKKPSGGKWSQQNSELLDYRYEDGMDRLPFFLELNPDGSEVPNGAGKRYRLQPNVTEVGSERGSPHGHSQSLQLFGPNVQPRHCVIAHTEGIVTVTPCSRDAETYVNGQRIYETTILQNGGTVRFGKIHNFRFLDPCYEERARQRYDSSRSHDYSYDSRGSTRDEVQSSMSGGGVSNVVGGTPTSAGPPLSHQPPQTPLNYETTFDVDGNVETRSTSSQGKPEDARSTRSIGSSREGNRLLNYDRYVGGGRGTEPILPAVLEIREETEEALLHALISDLDPVNLGFKLAPAYTLYLMARYRASTHYRPELTPTERAHRLTLIMARVAGIIHTFIQERRYDVRWLALWLANASELLHFLKSDRHISAFSIEAQETLADAVQVAFKHLVSCLQGELSAVMPSFLSEREDLSHDPEDSSTASVLGVLSSAMNLLRRCRVNAALTIQLFSQLFHSINVWLFNKLVSPGGSGYCSRVWGLWIKARLAQIEVWAERQGLELAADCHLARIIQAAHLLQAPKYTVDDLAALSSACFKLNSLQLRALLQNYQPTPDEPRIPHDIVENVVRLAENLADELARSDGREVRLEEDPELALPFLLPEDGYSCEVVRGVPSGLVDFLSPLQAAGLCRLTAQPTSSGLWTVYMGHPNSMVRSPSAMSNRSSGFVPSQQEPEVQVIKLHKSNNGMGLSIVAAKGAGQDRLGIYIKSVVKGGAADADGRLQAGDQLLKVDGQSLVGITQEKAAEYLVRTGPIVTLEVAKQGAIYHGLATLLSQPSPVMARERWGVQQPSHYGEGDYSPRLPVKSYSMGMFNDRYGCHDSPDELLEPGRPGSPTVLRISVPVITFSPPPSGTSGAPAIAQENLLSVPQDHLNCYKVQPENKLNLREDVFQEHQARLINCDSDDASAISQWSLPKVDIVRTFKLDERVPEWFVERLERAKEKVPAHWVPLSNTKPWKSDFYLAKSGEWKFINEEENLPSTIKRRSVSVDCMLDSSSSECDCMLDRSPQSTDSQQENKPTEKNVSTENLTEEEESISKRKLSNEERERALKELDEIVNGISKITEFANKDLGKESITTKNNGMNKMNEFLSSMLSEPKQPKTEIYIPNLESSSPSSSNEGDFEYGSGRVAALAKYFSDMGAAGIIRGRADPKRGLRKGVYKSEPELTTFNDQAMSPKPGDIILPPAAFDDSHTSSKDYDLVLSTKGLKPVGFSMDRLIDLGHGVIMKEIKCDIVNLGNKKTSNNNDTNDNNDTLKVGKIVTKSTQTSPLRIDCSKELSLSETALDDKNAKNCLLNSPSLPVINFVFPEPKKKRPPKLDLTKKSISVDEVEMRRRSNAASYKHYSLVDLGEVDKIDSLSNVTNQVISENLSSFCPSETIHLAYSGDQNRSMKRWMSVDETRHSNGGWSERLLERDRLDFGGTSSKDSLRRKCKTDAIKGRKLKRIKKLELQRSFIVTPVRLGQQRSSLDSPHSWFWAREPELSPRRLSERDLPSRVLAEQQGQASAHLQPSPHHQPQLRAPPHHPQIQSSKSVPSLNSNHEFERGNMPGSTMVSSSSTMPRQNHEVYNPGYSRTSSTNSIPQKAYEPPQSQHLNPHQIRSRSSQNLLENRQTTLPPNHIGQRQPSNPNLLPNNYPNHQIPYQQTPPGAPYHGQTPAYQTHQPPYQAPYQQHQPHSPYHQPPQQQPSPVADNGERFYQNLSVYRNQEMNGHHPTVTAAQPPPLQNGFGRGKMPSPQEEGRPPSNVPLSIRGSQSSLQSRSTSGEPARDRPTSAYLPNNYPSHQLPPSQGMTVRSQSSRDMLRQEAKFQEMSEEVQRRREMRSPLHGRPMVSGSGQAIPGSLLRYGGGYPGEPGGGGYRGGGPGDYSESPPPPPPPPTSTHPLYQPPPTRLPDNRYGASGSEPPRGSYYPPASTGTARGAGAQSYQGTNPWQREEREKEAERRRSHHRLWRDQTIAELSALPSRTVQQEEQLKALRLEKEFERRAEELDEEDEEDQDTAERVQGLLRVAQAEDAERRHQHHQQGGGGNPSGVYSSPVAAAGGSGGHTSSPYSPVPASAQYNTTPTSHFSTAQSQSLLNGGGPPTTTSRPPPPSAANYPLVSAEEKARLQRLKELKMKQAEVEAERNKKKEEEEAKNLRNSNYTGASLARTPPSSLRLDNLTISSPANNNHYHNNNGYSSSQASPPGPGAPPPPERGSSFAVTQSLRSPPTPTSLSSPPPPGPPPLTTAKRVSFQEPPQPSTNPPPPSSSLSDIREDPNNFINEAETMLASPTSPDTPFSGSTPGVIGAQEVYRDPRTRRLAEKKQQLDNKGVPVPEKLSFKEKMKMFAMETGEGGTPKDKVKISRAQRDIDNIGSPQNPNNNNNNNNNINNN